MNVDLLNHFIWRFAHDLVRKHEFFVVNNDEGVLTLRSSTGFVTTFVWLIPADQLNVKKMRRELEDSLTWMAAFRRRTPSVLFRSVHLFLFTEPKDARTLSEVTQLGSQTLIGRYQSTAWAVDLAKGNIVTPRLLLHRTRTLKSALTESLHEMKQAEQFRHMQGDNLYHEISVWQQEIGRLQQRTQQSYQKTVRRSAGAPVTFSIAGINLLVWVLMTIYGGSQNPEVLRMFGAKDNQLIAAGEYWRLFTPMFLHIGGLHLWFNSTALLSLGGHVERIYGHYRFILIYMIAGVFGAFSSYLFTPNLSAGASGAIFGLFGALLYFAIHNPSAFGHTMGPGLISGLGVNLVLGFIIPGIDNFAHLGGLVAGFITAFIIGLPRKKSETST